MSSTRSEIGAATRGSLLVSLALAALDAGTESSASDGIVTFSGAGSCGDGRGASVEAYLDLAKVGVPAGLLVGARLQLPPEPYP